MEEMFGWANDSIEKLMVVRTCCFYIDADVQTTAKYGQLFPGALDELISFVVALYRVAEGCRPRRLGLV